MIFRVQVCGAHPVIPFRLQFRGGEQSSLIYVSSLFAQADEEAFDGEGSEAIRPSYIWIIGLGFPGSFDRAAVNSSNRQMRNFAENHSLSVMAARGRNNHMFIFNNENARYRA